MNPVKTFNSAEVNSTSDSHIRSHAVSGSYVELEGDCWYRIANSHLMPEFFLSPVSSGDHWMFISSLGALSAGRRNPDSSVFPYYCADKLLDMAASTGAKTIFRIPLDSGGFQLWQPFERTAVVGEAVRRNFYRNDLGNKLILEETHDSLQLRFRYQWAFGNRFGFIRSCQLSNLSQEGRSVSCVDGFQNVLPFGLDRDFQLRYSNLGDAYKKNELVQGSRLGVYYLSSIPTDRAEPSEGLRATTVWQQGFSHPVVLLSTTQVEQFQRGAPVFEETEIRAHRGAYLVSSELHLDANSHTNWQIIANVGQDQTDVINLHQQIVDASNLKLEIQQDIADNTNRMLAIVSAADGRQLGNQRLRVHRHQLNVVFNVMRGGIPLGGYRIDLGDLLSHIHSCSKPVFERNRSLLNGLSGNVDLGTIQDLALRTNDSDLIRIAREYLPFMFSRRHGDPTRPWNSFSIDLLNGDGSQKIHYEGNWRDIFQNWEALSLSYPHYLGGMVFRFVNASTADGYNPYRLTKEGFEWESPDQNDPWANIGYWGDHQIIYLLKLLERSRSYAPSRLNKWLASETFTYAEVPYRIRPFEDICRDAQNTIDYDFVLADRIKSRVAATGADGKLLQGSDGAPRHVTLLEKLLIPLLVKITNFVPDGGVWLNTQRPEWNDANNALVGRGLSMVTTYYLRRYLAFLIDWFATDEVPELCLVSQDVVILLRQIRDVVHQNAQLFAQKMSDRQRKEILEALSAAGSDYRQRLYNDGLTEEKESLSLIDCRKFFQQCLEMIDHTIRSNRRQDGLYHSYNLLSLDDNGAQIKRLYEMLEGQVAVLSSGLLSASEAVEVLDALRASRIYREDQQSYMLYPDRELPTFLEKNTIHASSVESSELLEKLIADRDTSVVRIDVNGHAHFNGNFRNVRDLTVALGALATQPRYAHLVDEQRELVQEIFEETFHHADFTGRSGTFFAFEGLGSIYWHMVSKLALATIENVIASRKSRCDPGTVDRLHQHYREIRDGLGLNKSPDLYGGCPSDPYSHTPRHAGVQQPGMTGQVKEDILSRFLEIGVRIDNGEVSFDPALFECDEFLTEDSSLLYCDLKGDQIEITVSKDEFAFTICLVPVVYQRSSTTGLRVHFANAESVDRQNHCLTADESASVFSREGRIKRIDVLFNPSDCR